MARKESETVRPEIEKVQLTPEDYFSEQDEPRTQHTERQIERSEIVSRQPDLNLAIRILALSLVISVSVITVAFTAINWIYPAGICVFLFVVLFIGRELELD